LNKCLQIEMSPILTQATLHGARKACRNFFSKNNTIDKISNRQPVGPSYSRRHIPLRQPHVDAFLEEAERYRRPIERQPSINQTPTSLPRPAQETSVPPVQNAPAPPPTTYNAPLNAGERLQYLYLQKEAKNLKKQVQSLTSSLEVALEKLKDKLPYYSEELVKVNFALPLISCIIDSFNLIL
jgi:hypothetical protein